MKPTAVKKSAANAFPKGSSRAIPKGKKISEMKGQKQMSAARRTEIYKSQAHFEATKDLPTL
jgi:hypothetical protein